MFLGRGGICAGYTELGDLQGETAGSQQITATLQAETVGRLDMRDQFQTRVDNPDSPPGSEVSPVTSLPCTPLICLVPVPRYLDRFMAGHDIKEPQLYLVCCGSVLLASKICERESNIPRLSTLTALLPVKLAVSDLHSLE